MSIGRQTGACADGGLDRGGAAPLYHQLYLRLRDEILSGERAHDALLPTEHELAEQLGVSRITARRALDELAARGLVVRRRRVGTRVAFQSPQRPIEADIRQSIDALLDFGRLTQVDLVSQGEEPARGPTAQLMGLEPETVVTRIVRIRRLDDSPLGRITSTLPVEIGRTLDADALRSTPMLSLLEQAGRPVRRGSQVISATAADSGLTALLQVEPQSPILAVTRTLHDQTGAVVLLTRAEYRSDRYHIRLDLQPEDC